MSEMVVALRSVVTYVVIIAYVAVAGPLGLFIAVVFRWKRGLYALGHAGVSLALALAGIRYRVVGRERMPPAAVVFCSNHESNVDPPVLFMTLHPYLHILYKAELRQFPIMKTVLDVGGFVPIERADREKAAESIGRGAESLRAGSFSSFPKARAAAPDSCCRSRRGRPSGHRYRWFRCRCRGKAAMRREAPLCALFASACESEDRFQRQVSPRKTVMNSLQSVRGDRSADETGIAFCQPPTENVSIHGTNGRTVERADAFQQVDSDRPAWLRRTRSEFRQHASPRHTNA